MAKNLEFGEKHVYLCSEFHEKYNVMYLVLVREKRDGKAVRGHIYERHSYIDGRTGKRGERLVPLAPTLENADFLIPALIYKVAVTMSAKFGVLMPILMQVPGRTGIRIHGGTKPSHSQGCVLITRRREYRQLVEALVKEQETCAPIYLELRAL